MNNQHKITENKENKENLILLLTTSHEKHILSSILHQFGAIFMKITTRKPQLNNYYFSYFR